MGAAANDLPIATAPTGYDEGMNVDDEVKVFLMGIGMEEYYDSFMIQGFDAMEVTQTLSDEDLKNEIGANKL